MKKFEIRIFRFKSNFENIVMAYKFLRMPESDKQNSSFHQQSTSDSEGDKTIIKPKFESKCEFPQK